MAKRAHKAATRELLPGDRPHWVFVAAALCWIAEFALAFAFVTVSSLLGGFAIHEPAYGNVLYEKGHYATIAPWAWHALRAIQNSLVIGVVFLVLAWPVAAIGNGLGYKGWITKRLRWPLRIMALCLLCMAVVFSGLMTGVVPAAWVEGLHRALEIKLIR